MKATRDNQEVMEAFLAWEILGDRLWNFEDAPNKVYRIQCWTEEIKPEIIRAVSLIQDKPIEYHKNALIYEIYRGLLNGAYADKDTIKNITLADVLSAKIGQPSINGYSDTWKGVIDTLNRGESSIEIRNSAIRYFNLVQGSKGGDKKIYLDRKAFIQVFDEVIRELRKSIPEINLQLDDKAPSRRDIGKSLNDKILVKLDAVINDELEKNNNQITTVLTNNLSDELDEIEENDIKELLSKVTGFYNLVNDMMIRGIKCDFDLIDKVKRTQKLCMNAIHILLKIQETDNNAEKLLLLSKDPLKYLSGLIQVINNLEIDLTNVEAEIASRMKKIDMELKFKDGKRYEQESKTVNDALSLIEMIGGE